jgi:hypothetical protein
VEDKHKYKHYNIHIYIVYIIYICIYHMFPKVGWLEEAKGGGKRRKE